MCSGATAAPLTPPIVFSADRAPSLSGEVYRLDSGGRLVDLSNSPFPDFGALVSPNGSRVVFGSHRPGGGIYVVSVDGSGPQRLETPPLGVGEEERFDFAWAPNSKQLALSAGTGSAASLSLVAPGRSPRVLARRFVSQPKWSPDGLSLIHI